MVNKNDWRLMGQEEYLKNQTLIFHCHQKWSAEWNHDHCEFCTRHFGCSPDGLHEGYSTIDNYRWICKDCFNDFKEMFNWRIEEPV